MSKVKVYRYKRPYDGRADSEPIADRMATRDFIQRANCTIIEETELEVDCSKVDSFGKTDIGFAG
jgi:hypothetical protein